MRFKYLAYLLMTQSLLVAEQSEWIASPGDGSWQIEGNWTNGIPGITGSVNNLDLEALFDFSSPISNISINLEDPVRLNRMTINDQSCTLSGKSLYLIEDKGKASNVTLFNASIYFDNPLFITGEAVFMEIGISSGLFINKEFTCSNAVISFISTMNPYNYLGPPVTMTNSKATLSNSVLTISALYLNKASLDLTNNTSFNVPVFFMDSSSLITLNDAQFNYIGNDPVQPGNIKFVLTKNFIEIPYFSSGSADIDLSESKNTISLGGLLPVGSNTFTLYQVGLPNKIEGFSHKSFVLPQNTSNIIWHGPILTKIGDVTVTADVQHSVSASIRSVMSTNSQVTLSTARQLEKSRQNARIGNQTFLSTNASNQEGSHVAQNTILSQATPVEQLWERGVYRPTHNWSVYVAPLGSFGSTKSKNLQPGSDFYTAGFFAGFDWMNSYHPQSDIGFGIGSTFYYSRLHSDTEHHAGKVDVDHIFANIYGTVFPRRLEELSFNFAIGGGYDWYDMERVTGHFGSLVAHSKTQGYEIGSFAGIEYLFSKEKYARMGNFRFMPMLYLQYNRLEINEYSEHGAGEFNMRVRTDDLDSLISFLGARANYTFIASQNVTIRPEMTIGWQREYLSDSISSSFNTIELATPQGVCSTIAPERNTLIVGADIYVKMFQQTSLELNYQFTYNNILRDHEFYLQWKFEF